MGIFLTGVGCAVADILLGFLFSRSLVPDSQFISLDDYTNCSRIQLICNVYLCHLRAQCYLYTLVVYSVLRSEFETEETREKKQFIK